MSEDVTHEHLAEKIGELRGTMKGVQADICDVKTDVNRLRKEMVPVRAAISEARGGWKVIVAVGAVAGTMGAAVGKFLPFLKP